MSRRGRRGAQSKTRSSASPAIVVCLGIVALVAAIYAQTAGFGYVTFDDDLYAERNPVVRAGLTSAGATWALAETHLGFWIPATWLSLMLDVELFGPSAGAHHLVNAALHAANALLLLALLLRTTGALWPSALAAALFAAHPLRVESVAWVTERKDVLCALFWLLAILAYVGYAARPSWRRYLAVAACAALALASKPMAVTLPVTLLLVDAWPLGRQRPWRALVWEKAPLFALSAGAAVVTFLAHRAEGATKPIDAYPIAARAANAVVSYAAYLGKAVWPAGLAVFYPYPEQIPSWQVWLAGALLATVTALALILARPAPYLLWGWCWYLATLVPVIGLVQAGEQAMADRFSYVPLVGPFVAVSWGARDLVAWRPAWRRPVAAAAVAAVVLLGVAAWFQTRVWRDGATLFRHALATTRDNAVARHNLARALSGQGQIEEAVEHYETALRLDPDRAVTRVSLGGALLKLGRTDEARRHLEEAVSRDPADAGAHANLGLALVRSGRRDAGRAEYEEALVLDPANADAMTNLATLEHEAGRTGEAIRLLERAVAADPTNETARDNLEQLRGQGRASRP